ncbi:MAG: endonuclease NucS domain-containing protein [Phycisphaerae bacterium]
MPRPYYSKSCHEIMAAWLQQELQEGRTITADEIRAYMQQNWPKLKASTVDCNIRKLTTNDPVRVHYGADGRSDLLFRVGRGPYRLYDAASDPKPIYDKSEPPPDPGSDEGEGTEFAYESDLRDFLAHNLGLIEKGLRLFADEGITGVEYPAGSGSIDLLCRDRRGAYVVVELKVSRGDDKAVGQIARYMTWVRENLAEGKEVRGIIIARNPSDNLKAAARALPNASVYAYELSVDVTPIQRAAGSGTEA